MSTLRKYKNGGKNVYAWEWKLSIQAKVFPAIYFSLWLSAVSIFFMKIDYSDISAPHIYSQCLSFFVGILFENGHCRRSDFLSAFVESGRSRKTGEKIWRRGTYNNNYLSIVHTDFVAKRGIHSAIKYACVDKETLDKVKWLNWYKRLITWLQAWSPKKFEKTKNQEMYLRKNKSVTNRGLARKGGLVNKGSASKRIHNATKQFWGKITTRWTTYLWMTARLSNHFSNSISYRFDRYSNHNGRVSQETGVKSQKQYIEREVWKYSDEKHSYLPKEWYISYNFFYLDKLETI